jgi:hypothetical protein
MCPPSLEEERRQVWAMTPAQRVTAMRAGRLSSFQCSVWAARCPHEVPILNGEFEFIAVCMPEAIES